VTFTRQAKRGKTAGVRRQPHGRVTRREPDLPGPWTHLECADSNASEKRQGTAPKRKGPDIAGGVDVIANGLANDKHFVQIPELIGQVDKKYV
jgi:hypothetical protein